MVRMRNSRRTPCTCFIAGCRLGAYRKQMPTSRRHCAERSGESWMLMPSASMTSAEPHFELMLRLPCLATRDACSGGHERGGGRNVEGAAGVAAGAAGVDQRVVAHALRQARRGLCR